MDDEFEVRAFVRAIAFGRFAYRPAMTDLARLAAQQWRGRPALERAFLDGYGPDPREPDLWRLNALREAIGAACWAYQVRDEPFERQGHRVLAEALAERGCASLVVEKVMDGYSALRRHYSLLARDAVDAVTWVRRRLPGVPVTLLGYSKGRG